MNKSLYLVKLTRFEAYVVATNPTLAHEAFKTYLDKNNIEYDKDRKFSSISLIASEENAPLATRLPLIL